MSSAAVKQSNEAIPVTIGLERADRKHLAELLEKALSDTYVLYAKIQGVHWNVSGPMFLSVHKMTEEQYEDLAESIDKLAERMRALGYAAPTKLARFLELSDIAEADQEPSAHAMVEIPGQGSSDRRQEPARGGPRGRQCRGRVHGRHADRAHRAAREFRLDAARAWAIGRPGRASHDPKRSAAADWQPRHFLLSAGGYERALLSPSRSARRSSSPSLPLTARAASWAFSSTWPDFTNSRVSRL